MNIFLVVLAGGNGTRLWPLSRASKPKQFLSFCPEGTMLQKVINRNSFVKVQETIILAGAAHMALIGEQLDEINMAGTPIIVEPEAKNTAPAIITAALKLYQQSPDSLMMVTPSDNEIARPDEYKKSINAAIDLAQSGYYVTIAIKPLRAEVAYGYLKQGMPINEQAFMVEKFFEKPNLKRAREYVISGNYFWNSGIFIFPIRRFLDDMALLEPIMLQYIRDALEKATIWQNKIFLDKDAYGQIHANSIDYALMEKAQGIAAVKGEFFWNDMGTLRSIWEAHSKDINGNVLSKNAITINTRNMYINSASHRMIAAVDVNGISVIEMSDILLIANSNSSHNIRRVVNELNEINWNSITEPWGQSETLACGEEFFIRKIKVKPEKNIAIQPGHNHGQHWIIISGVAQVTNGSMIDIYKKNDYFFVHLHEAYSIANHSLGYLELIEVYTMRKHDAKKVT